jgi:hypothetical protein
VDEGRNRLTEEGFALNLVGHTVGEMRKGGPGIRYVLDLWVYRHLHEPQPVWDAVLGRLGRDGMHVPAMLKSGDYSKPKRPSFQAVGPPFHVPAPITDAGTPYGLTATLDLAIGSQTPVVKSLRMGVRQD